MSFDPINPVALIASAATGIGAACARELARRADGGLVLADRDENALEASADGLDRAPERVSTLAFEPSDPHRWSQAMDFVAAQYGRLDWALLDAGAAFPRREDYLDATRCGLDAVLPLIGDNRDGGAIVLLASAAALQEELETGDGDGLLGLLRVAAREAERQQVRLSALAFGDPRAPGWRRTPLFSTLLEAAGGESDAFAKLVRLAPPVACLPGAELGRLLPLVIAEAVGGVTLVVDGGHTL